MQKLIQNVEWTPDKKLLVNFWIKIEGTSIDNVISTSVVWLINKVDLGINFGGHKQTFQQGQQFAQLKKAWQYTQRMRPVVVRCVFWGSN